MLSQAYNPPIRKLSARFEAPLYRQCLFSFGEEEEKALKAQEKEDKRILEEKGFSLSDGDELKGVGEFLLDDVDEDLW